MESFVAQMETFKTNINEPESKKFVTLIIFHFLNEYFNRCEIFSRFTKTPIWLKTLQVIRQFSGA